jgi:two-component system, OmpR family, sensor kinase
VSLRARLIAGLLLLATVGLVTLGVVTYAEQRSFLMKRVDQQARAASAAISGALDRAGANVPGFREGSPIPGGGPFGGGLRGGALGGPGFGAPGRGDGRGPGPPPAFDLPPNTFGQRRDASGRPLKPNVMISFGQNAVLPAPKLPGKLPLGKLFTVGSVTGSVHYRVLAEPTGDQPGVTIAAVPMRDVDQTLHRLLVVEAIVIASILAALGALSWWLVRLGLRPLDRIAETAGAIAAGDLSQRVTPATKRTEVGRLGLALNAMLVQIEKAFAERQASEGRLRRFLADASHELRTPLASIRGYAELFRIGAAREPEKIEKAMRRIEDEATRMGNLVENLLTLARLDQLPELSRRPVDLTQLASDAADDARAAAPDRQVELDAAEGVTVLGDASQLRQVIGNLVRNALVHTPPRTPIEVRVAGADDQATLEVRDHGNGLPTDDTDALFERFWRADPGRERGAAGAGLGLSIVAAIVTAHGGHVTAQNTADGGASFVIALPASLPSPAPAVAISKS